MTEHPDIDEIKKMIPDIQDLWDIIDKCPKCNTIYEGMLTLILLHHREILKEYDKKRKKRLTQKGEEA